MRDDRGAGHARFADECENLELSNVETDKTLILCHASNLFLMLRGLEPQSTVRVQRSRRVANIDYVVTPRGANGVNLPDPVHPNELDRP